MIQCWHEKSFNIRRLCIQLTVLYCAACFAGAADAPGAPGMVWKGWACIVLGSPKPHYTCSYNVTTRERYSMSGADAVVRARIDLATKQEATILFRKMGITISDAIRMMLVQAVADKALPFEVRVPNAETTAALLDSRNGVVTRAASVDDLFADDDES